MPTTDAIQPLHRLPFTEFTPGGAYGMATNPVAPTVYVAVPQSLVDPFAAALAYWPWLLTPTATIALAFTLWRTLRILSRRQRPGAPHCRKCNYDLSGAIAAPRTASLSLGALTKGEGRGEGSIPPAFSPSSTSCPECGKPLTPRNIRKGRSTPRRLAPLAIPLVILLALASTAAALALGWRPTLAPWPSPTAQRFADRLSISVPNAFLVECDAIIEADLATGATLRTVVQQAPQLQHFSVAPTGDAIVMSSRESPFGLVAFSTRDGRELNRLEYPPQPDGAGSVTTAFRINSTICGFSHDATAVYVLAPDYGPPITTSVVKWNLADGSTTILASLPTYRNELAVERSCKAIVLPGSAERVLSWCDDAHSSQTQTCTLEIRTGQGPPQTTADFGPGCERLNPSAVTADGSRVFLLRSQQVSPGVRRRQLLSVSTADLRPLEVTNIPAQEMKVYAANDPAGRFVAVAGNDGVALWNAPAPTHQWTSLATPSDVHFVPAVAFSHDGRFLTAIGIHGGDYPNWRYDLLIWDLTPLRTKLPPAPGN